MVPLLRSFYKKLSLQIHNHSITENHSPMKKKLNFKILSVCIMLFLPLSAFIQSDKWIQELSRLLEEYNRKMPDEKVYLHVDKTLLKPGEDLWFAAYVTSGYEYSPSTVSGALHVELTDPKGNIASQLLLKITHGKASGSFQINSGMAGGIYKIRAYTQWQKNWNNDCVFEKEIIVQKIVVPKLLLKIDFLKEAYGRGDTVTADLDIRDLKNEPVRNHPVTYTSMLNGIEVLRATGYTNEEGKLKIVVPLPLKLTSNDGIINAVISYDGSAESISRSIPIVLNKISLRFFPEGGDMLSDYENRIAFKALNEFGKPADVKGVILDELMNSVTDFESYHQGMGTVSFKPVSGHKYFARITTPSGNDTLFSLPEALAEGYMLNIIQKERKSLLTEITSSKQAAARLIAQVRGKIYYSQMLNLDKGRNSIRIPTESFPSGIVQITLFDDYGNPRCERLAFLNPEKKMNISIKTNKEKYAPREKVKLSLMATDENNKPVAANLSVAVVNNQILSYADDKQDNIQSYMWLSSEVTGDIYEPAFYFNPEEPKREKALDNLLMTQGWRRFKWNDVTEKKYSVSFLPDLEPVIAGQVIDIRTNKGVKAKLGIISKNNGVTADQLTTDENGNFFVFNLDPSATIALYAHSSLIRSNNLIIRLDEERTTFSTHKPNVSTTRQVKTVIPDIIEPASIVREAEIQGVEQKSDQNENNQEGVKSSIITLEENVQGLYEVVVIGYGVQAKQDLTGSAEVINAKSIVNGTRIEQSLQGKVAGVEISQETQQLDGGEILRIRGHNSVLNGEPLFIIDGVPVFETSSNILTPLCYLSQDDIENMVIVKTPRANLLYGATGGTGFVTVSSKEGSSNPYYNYGSYGYKNTFSTITVYPKNKYDFCKEFYVPEYNPRRAVNIRNDFRQTIFWNQEIETNADGTATMEFCNSDEITTFKVVAEGISANGLIGHEEFNYFTQIPVSISVKLPAYCTDVDTLVADVIIKNNTEDSIQGGFDILLPDNLSLLGPFLSKIPLLPNSVYNITVRLKPGISKSKSNPVTFYFMSSNYSDAVTKETEVIPNGFPVTASFSNLSKDESFSIDIGQPVKGTLNATFTAYPTVLADIQSGMESVFLEPHGCFEQVSATIYPEIMTLKFLKETGKIKKSTEDKALGYIKEGYKMLAGYETPEKGFEWWGHTPPNEGLTAFGLQELIEMKDVYPGVSDDLINRTKKWLLSRRAGDGTFHLNAGKYGFSGAAPEVSNAYIVYALAESGLTLSEIEPEYKASLRESLASLDSYRLALMANAAYDLGDDPQAQIVMSKLKGQIKEKGNGRLPVNHTLVRSWGESAQIETAALIFLAELKSDQPDFALCHDLLSYLVKNRSYGGFGSTQGTTLALRALTRYAELLEKELGENKVNIYLSDRLVESRSFLKDQPGKITIPDLEQYMSTGENTFRVKFDSLTSVVPYSIDLEWKTYTPVTVNSCPLDLKVSLAGEKVKTGETVRLTASVINKTSSGLPMTIVLLGIPGGLTPQPWQLKELMEKQEFAYYEIYRNYLVLYYNELGADEVRTVNLDLKAEVRGTYTAPANSAYIYYNDAYKKWTPGNRITIE
jgi:alpha-2-macroglobulin-like protein